MIKKLKIYTDLDTMKKYIVPEKRYYDNGCDF